jgi:hypothetical protein
MSDLTAKFASFEEQVATEHTALMDAIADLQASIDLVASNTDLALENNAANTKALLQALGQTGGCFPCPTPSIDVPGITTDPTPVDDDHCQRSQWIITTIQTILSKFDTLQSFNVPGTFSVLNDAISQITSALGSGDTVPLPSFPETVNIVGDYISYAGERAFSGVSLSTQFAPLYGPLVTATAIAGSASDAQAAYAAVIDASDASNGAKLLFKAIAFAALWSYAFDPASTPDLSPFDGGACGVELPSITACTNFGGAPIEVSAGTTLYALIIPPSHADGPTAIGGNYAGWSFEVLSNEPGHDIQVYYWDLSHTLHLATSFNSTSGPYTLVATTEAIAVQTEDANAGAFPFTVRICPPA